MTDSRIIHSTDFNDVPLWFRAINGGWKYTYPVGTKIKLEKDNLIKSARKNTGLHDLGKDFWDEPLERLHDSMNNEAKLHPIGRFISKKRLVNMLSVRLRAEEYFKKHPEILDQPLYPVMVIIGLQRTGTTKLHRMLASEPDTRALLSWEAINPAPMKGDGGTNMERIKMARMSEKALKIMSPGFFAIHPVEHLAPEEDVLLLDYSFLSTTPEATMHVPSYASWLEQTDQSPAYEYAVKLMKLLQWQMPAKKWVLKTPHHLEFLDLADKYFNDVQFIWTHRNVLEAIPSFLSMMSFARTIFSDDVDPNAVAKHWVRKVGYMLSKAMDYRAKNNHNDKFIDISYQNLVSDGIEEMKKIYRHCCIDLTTDVLQIFKETESNNPQGKYGRHIYNLSDFGIDEGFIDKHTIEYHQFQKKIFVK